jgi:hypothetical protein
MSTGRHLRTARSLCRSGKRLQPDCPEEGERVRGPRPGHRRVDDEGAPPWSSTRPRAARTVARRRPSASAVESAVTSAASSSVNDALSSARSSVMAPQVVESVTSVQRNSSPSPCGPRTSRCRKLRSRAPRTQGCLARAEHGLVVRQRSSQLTPRLVSILMKTLRG